MKVVGLFLILILTVPLPFALAEEDLISVKTNKDDYYQGDVIQISGKVSKNLFG